MTYRLALLTSIPVVRIGAVDRTLDLWVRDLLGQAEAVQELVLFAPIVDAPVAGWINMQPLPERVKVVDPGRMDPATLRQTVDGCDLVQVPGNFTWRRSAAARRLMRIARSLGKPTIVGISSDRAKTEIMNARGAGALQRLRACLNAASIRVSQSYLVWRADGAFVVGEGLRRIVARWSRNVHVGTASWIRSSDIVPVRSPRPAKRPWRLCAAGRLEPMKGIHLAIDALADLLPHHHGASMQLDIAGVGSEDVVLKAQAVQRGVDRAVRFVGSLAYPEPFFALLRDADLVLLTNLNDEQPRLVFDAISQGCLPVCPDSLPYRSLGLPPELLYRRGDAASLAGCIERLIETPDLSVLGRQVRLVAQAATIETMHSIRHDWVRTAILAGRA